MVVVSLLMSGSVAYAQPGVDGAPMPPPDDQAPPPPPEAAPMLAPVPPPVQAPVSKVDKGVLDDANSGRAWLMPTGLSDPAGTWSFSDFELLLIGAGYAVTDELSVSLTTLLPITNDIPFWMLANVKYQIINSGRVRGAVQAAFTYSRDTSGSTTSSLGAGEVGGALTLCLDDECHSHASGFLGAGFAQESDAAVPFLVAGSIAGRLNKHVKIVVEADSAFIAGKINETANGFLLWYGVRFTSRNIGVDLGLMKPIYDGSSNDTLVLGFPFVSFTYRSLKDD
jgi:hypothetical protein